jgi:YidC/Oxa1 family membrane protein insertase
MDRKSIIVLVVAIGLLFVVSPVVDHFFPPKPAPAQPFSHLTNSITNSSSVTGTNAVLSQQNNLSNAPISQIEVMATPAGPEKTLIASNADLILEFTSHGGGIKAILLRDYPAIIARKAQLKHGELPERNYATLNGSGGIPVLALIGNDIQGDNYFDLTQTGNVVEARKTLPGGLRIVKKFDIGTNYLFTATVSLENASDKPISVPQRELVIGTASAIGPLDDPTAMGVMWYNGYKNVSIKDNWFANHAMGCAVLPSTPRTRYEEGSNNVVWAAALGQFFALATIPSNAAPEIVIDKIAAAPPPAYGLINAKPELLTNGYRAGFSYPAATLAPGKSIESSYTLYAGAKEYNRLAQIGQRMNNNLDLVMDFSGVFGFFSKFLLLCMNGLHAIGLPYGVTIIALTVIIKLVFWPLTNAATKSQKRLQELQPQLKAIADKYKDDPVKKNQKTMDFMKQHKVSPLGSCLPMALQIPIFIGFYWMLRNAIELRGVHFLWSNDLSQPDTIAYLGTFAVNPLPLIMGATQLWQAHLTPPSPGMDEGQQKIMRYMPLIFIAVFYRMASGLTLYWTVQNLLTIFQTKLTKTGTPPASAVAPAAGLPPRKKM